MTVPLVRPLMGTRYRARQRLLAHIAPTRSRTSQFAANASWQLIAIVGAAVLAAFLSTITATTLTLIYGLWVRRAWKLRRQRNALHQAEQSCADAFAGLAADLRAGAAPDAALVTAAGGLHESTQHRFWIQLIAAIHGGRAIAQLGQAPIIFRQPCERLAIAWRLLDAGISLAPILDILEAELRALLEQRQRAAVETAGARATASALLFLPAVGVLFGYALGADPLRVLLHTGLGTCCVIGGVGLQWVGWAWAERLCTVENIGR